MKIVRIILSAMLLFCLCFTVFFGAKKISEKKSDDLPFRGVISLCEIDTFEGGKGSRRQFLLSLARKYEKKHTGILIMVSDYTEEAFAQAISDGEEFDITSFGAGVNVVPTEELKVKSEYSGGKINGKNYAAVWCRGGYFLISNKSNAEFPKEIDSLLVSQNEHTLPLAAFFASGFTAKNIDSLKPFDAYYKFTGGKNEFFLGTQRDIIRLTNRGAEFSYFPLDGFNDLYQCFSVTGRNAVKNAYAKDFIEFVLSETCQKELYKIGMASNDLKTISDIPAINDLQTVKYRSYLNCFTSKEVLSTMQKDSVAAAKGDNAAQIKIKNMFVSP